MKLVSPQRAVPPSPVQQRPGSARTTSSPAVLEARHHQGPHSSAEAHTGSTQGVPTPPAGPQLGAAAFPLPLHGHTQPELASGQALPQPWASMPVPQVPYRWQQPAAQPQAAQSAPWQAPQAGLAIPSQQEAGPSVQPPAPVLTFRVPHLGKQLQPSGTAGLASRPQSHSPTRQSSAPEPAPSREQNLPMHRGPAVEQQQQQQQQHPRPELFAAQQAALRLQQQPQHSAAQGLDQRLGLVAGSAGTAAPRPQLQAAARSPAQPNIMDWRPEEYAGVKLLMDDSTMVQSFAEQVQSMPLDALMPMQAQLRWVPAYHLPPWSTSISRPSTHDPELHDHG